jgi:hypothetical protein
MVAGEASPQVQELDRGGRHLNEIRMPSDHFAVLVRR